MITMPVAVKETTWKRLQNESDAGTFWRPTKSDSGLHIIEVDFEVYQLIKEDPDRIINQHLDARYGN